MDKRKDGLDEKIMKLFRTSINQDTNISFRKSSFWVEICFAKAIKIAKIWKQNCSKFTNFESGIYKCHFIFSSKSSKFETKVIIAFFWSNFWKQNFQLSFKKINAKFTWMVTVCWLSAAVEKIWDFLVGTTELRPISLVMTPPTVSIPRVNGHTSRRTTSTLSSPERTPA